MRETIQNMLVFRSVSAPWVTSSIASKDLGFSEKTLKCWRDCGYLKSGKHWKYSRARAASTVIYQIDLCREEMNQWWGRDALIGP